MEKDKKSEVTCGVNSTTCTTGQYSCPGATTAQAACCSLSPPASCSCDAKGNGLCCPSGRTGCSPGPTPDSPNICCVNETQTCQSDGTCCTVCGSICCPTNENCSTDGTNTCLCGTAPAAVACQSGETCSPTGECMCGTNPACASGYTCDGSMCHACGPTNTVCTSDQICCGDSCCDIVNGKCYVDGTGTSQCCASTKTCPITGSTTEAICCPNATDTCYTNNTTVACCPSGQACTVGSQTICCPSGEVCYADTSGNPNCCDPANLCTDPDGTKICCPYSTTKCLGNTCCQANQDICADGTCCSSGNCSGGTCCSVSPVMCSDGTTLCCTGMADPVCYRSAWDGMQCCDGSDNVCGDNCCYPYGCGGGESCAE